MTALSDRVFLTKSYCALVFFSNTSKLVNAFFLEAKRQKEIPEETIDMTDPVEGGSLEDDSTEVKSGEVKHLIKDTEQLSEDRLQQHLSEIKRNKHSSVSKTIVVCQICI